MNVQFRLPSLFVSVIFATAIGCSTAFAGPVTYLFSGALTDIRGTGAGFSFGDHFDAQYSHDDSLQTGSLIEPNRMHYSGGQFSVIADGQSLVGPGVSELQVFNDWTYLPGGYDHSDGYFVSSYIYDVSGFTLIQFDMWDHSGATLSSLDMPTQGDVQNLAQEGRVFIRRFESGTEVGLASGNFSQMVPQSVPDSCATVLMLGSALGWIVAMRRRFKG